VASQSKPVPTPGVVELYSMCIVGRHIIIHHFLKCRTTAVFSVPLYTEYTWTEYGVNIFTKILMLSVKSFFVRRSTCNFNLKTAKRQ